MLPRLLGLSLLGHAVLLTALPERRAPEASRRRTPLELVAFEPLTAPLESASPPAVAGAPAPPRPTARRPPPRPTGPAVSASPALPAEATPTTCTPGEEPGRGDRAPGSAAPVEPAPAPKSGSSATSAATGEPVDLDAVDVEAIRRAIDHHLVYPLKARRMGWSGQVRVAFELDAGGLPAHVRVTSSSGFASLDEAAVEAVQRAAPFLGPGRPVRLAVPVAFRLNP